MTFAQREDLVIAQLCSRLIAEYRHRWRPDHIGGEVFTAYCAFQNAPVRDFIPVLVERRVREALETGQSAGPGTEVPTQVSEAEQQVPGQGSKR